MKQEDEKLRVCLRKAMEMDDIRLDEEMKNSEPHEFSQEFEEKMEKVKEIAKRKTTPFQLKRFAAAAAVLLVVVGVLGVGLNATKAEKTSTDILAWMSEYFTFEKGNDDRYDSEMLFDEAQIGYIPSGFYINSEEIGFSTVRYKYINDAGNYFFLAVSRDKNAYVQDGESVEYVIKVNLAGYEYAYTYKEEVQCHVLSWTDESGIFYHLSGTAAQDEMVKVMDGIQYERRN